MNNPYQNSENNLRYFSYQYYLKKKYGIRVYKVPLDAGFTCPNRDGTYGIGGCSFCTSTGSGEFAGNRHTDLLTQFYNKKESLSSKWPNGKSIAYFQAFSNTYGSVHEVQAMIEPFLKLDEVLEISIATRPDCLSDEMISLLNELSHKKEIWLELGLQTIHDKTAVAFNRSYTTSVFADTIQRLSTTNIKICVHIINGLVNETPAMMLETAMYLANLPIHAIKIHMLHLMHNSSLGQSYLNQAWSLLREEEYVQIVADQLEILPPDLIIERLTGDGAKDLLIAPLWTIKKIKTLNEIQKELVKRNTYQGIHYKQEN